MSPISRRTALLLGGLGLAATATGATGILMTLSARPSPTTGDALTQPPLFQSSAGRLDVRLEATQATVPLAGRPASCFSYNGAVPGPTLRVRPGDSLAISLVNKLREPTNLHLHGLHVSPQGNGDNAFISVEPGSTFRYEHRIPEDHPPGVYWYHPHHHGNAADQLFAGLFGAIIVEDPVPLEVSRERVLVVSDTTLDASWNIRPPSAVERMAGREGRLLLVNGQLNPGFDARPGERERWRVINACVSRYIRLSLEGQPWQLLGIDSGAPDPADDATEVLLAPGNRADLAVTAVPGESILLARPYERSRMGPGSPDGSIPAAGTTLATLRVAGVAGPALKPLGGRPEPADLRSLPVDARRHLAFGGGGMMGMMDFTINGRRFDATRTDTTAAAGSVEEWTLSNASPMDHPFHLHVWPMQLVEEGGLVPDAVLYREVVNVPAGGQVRVRVAFTDFTGKSVYHCHILDHEDLGMMGVIDVS
ncbi:multicopper oxidase family protein [Arthrobacter celericrescens]|uniref:multicopper oxidase family protein n=1 Tax=Arthrobacter celericrescens TaxID=2320851 RepID=UPI000EA38E60|nr:multicopper oxidase family protein [Arthrobacter celericrescens]